LTSSAASGSTLALLLLVLALGLGLAWVWRDRTRLRREHATSLEQAERRLELALSASGEQFWELDLERRSLRRLHMRLDPVQGGQLVAERHTDWDGVIHPDDATLVRARLVSHLKGEADAFVCDLRIREAEGSWRRVRAHGRATAHDPHGRVTRVSGVAHQIGDPAGVRAHPVADGVERNMREAVCVMHPDFSFVSVNPAFTQITGYAPADVLGRQVDLLDSPQHDSEFYAAIRAEVLVNGRWAGELWARRKDGEEFLCSMVFFAIGQPAHPPQTLVAVFSDITHQKRAEQELRYLANFDALTNLPNRALLSERLSRAIVRARREGTRIAVLFLDFDHFKDINDSLGHAAGDRILRVAATRLQETVGEQSTVARLGGDEFTVVVEDVASPEDADHLAREIIMAFEAPLRLDERVEVAISPSIGISLYPDHGQVPTELLKRADTAMYQAKAAGRRTFSRYDDSMEVALRERATVSGALRKVLDRGELRLVFQPRMSLPQRRIVGVEALLRWQSSEHGDVPPAVFIPLAEETGLILELGEWVLREACLTLRRWQQSGLQRLSMSVNVSALQLLRGDFPLVVERVLAETGLAPDLLELELTESVIMANAEQTADKLQSFRRTGVSLAIDDFGTGYSSLAYLRRLPITTLKIDKEFIGDLSSDPDDASITTTVITMAHSLGLNVVAEGVETREQLDFLDAQGCDEIQGYWLSPPMESERCQAFLRDWRPQDIRTAAVG
jgi:diguanylate cyclase (GGDEF)-like protein/PAS domain S-box-containing protein